MNRILALTSLLALALPQGKWLELYSRCPITMLSPGSAGPNWAATSPAADDTEGISAISAGSAPISLATAERAWPAAPPTAVVQADGGPLVDELVIGVREPPAGQADRSGVEVRPARGRREQVAGITDTRGLRRRYRVRHDLNLPLQ